ncbi:MAG: type II secretion system protein [Planctomycetes bacterium]|nr:type II secretion system protein [Planctomycetota bacterium]
MTSATGKTMSLETRPRSHAGFTMVELLVTISLIVFLMSMLAVGAGRYLENTSAKATEALIARISLNLGTYKGITGSFPPDGLDGVDVITEEGTPLTGGAALTLALTQPMKLTRKVGGEVRIVGENPPIGDFRSDELYVTEEDPDACQILDAWANPLHYDNVMGGDEAFSPQSLGETHLDFDEDLYTHMEDSREIEDLTGVLGPQNTNEYDIWSHGSSGHEDTEEYEDYITNWNMSN